MSVLFFAETSCASPSSIFAGAKITRNHGAFLRFADINKSVKHSSASRFRRMFARNEQTSRRGEACAFKGNSALTKPINPARIFSSFCLFFFKQEKEGSQYPNLPVRLSSFSTQSATSYTVYSFSFSRTTTFSIPALMTCLLHIMQEQVPGIRSPDLTSMQAI